MKLIFVYNVDSNLMALIGATAHKLASSKTYTTCNLCKLTYPGVFMNKEWKQFIASLPFVTTFLHRDEFVKEYPDQKDIKLPAAFIEDGSNLRLVISEEEISRAKNLSELIDITKHFINNQ